MPYALDSYPSPIITSWQSVIKFFKLFYCGASLSFDNTSYNTTSLYHFYKSQSCVVIHWDTLHSGSTPLNKAHSKGPKQLQWLECSAQQFQGTLKVLCCTGNITFSHIAQNTQKIIPIFHEYMRPSVLDDLSSSHRQTTSQRGVIRSWH